RNEPYPVLAKNRWHPRTPFAKTPHHLREEHAEHCRAQCVQRCVHRQDSFEVSGPLKPPRPAKLGLRFGSAGWPRRPYPSPSAIRDARLRRDLYLLVAGLATAGLSVVAAPSRRELDTKPPWSSRPTSRVS